MNATFGEVLREVLKGLLITEPNVKRSRIRGRCPEMKKVPRWSRIALGCHAQTMRERERETNRKAPSQRVPNMEMKRYVCMSM